MFITQSKAKISSNKRISTKNTLAFLLEITNAYTLYFDIRLFFI